MKIIFLSWKSFGNDDILKAFQNKGHIVINLNHDNKDDSTDRTNVDRFKTRIKELDGECVFSFNYFPVVAMACKDLGLPYLSWIYDSPYVRLYHFSIVYKTNYVFVFDSSVYLEFHRNGIDTVHYLPMAADTDRLNSMTNFIDFDNTQWKNRHEVAFVGSLYTEKHQFYQRLTKISDYTRGFLEGLMKAQMQVYGYNFIQEILEKNTQIVRDMQEALPMTPGNESVETVEFLFAQYVINRQITGMERKILLEDISEKFGLDLYTPDKRLIIDGCTNHGPVDYYDFAPYVFKKAKINLNISLRSIHSGIPLRAFDIMGAGGFLLTNYQPDFLEFFVPDEDYVYYDSQESLMDKIEYYLKHEDERIPIANNGFEKIKAKHTYKHRVDEMLSYL